MAITFCIRAISEAGMARKNCTTSSAPALLVTLCLLGRAIGDAYYAFAVDSHNSAACDLASPQTWLFRFLLDTVPNGFILLVVGRPLRESFNVQDVDIMMQTK